MTTTNIHLEPARHIHQAFTVEKNGTGIEKNGTGIGWEAWQ